MNQSKHLPITFLKNQRTLDPLETNLRTEHIPNHYKLLILDRISSNSSFLSLNFISKAIKANRPVLFLSFNFSYHHWSSLLQKQSIQLNSLTYKERFKFIDGLTLNLNQEKKIEGVTKLLSKLIHEQVNYLSQFSEQSPLVLIDDLTSIIWSSFFSSNQWIHCFQSLFPSLHLPKSFSLIMIFHDDLVASNSRDREIFNHLISRSDLILRTRALAGSVRGELIVQRGPNNLIDLELPVTSSVDQTTQYKIVDNTVTYYPKGLDRGFI